MASTWSKYNTYMVKIRYSLDMSLKPSLYYLENFIDLVCIKVELDQTLPNLVQMRPLHSLKVRYSMDMFLRPGSKSSLTMVQI